MTTVSDVMTRGVRSMSPRESLVQAAQAMDELNVGALPVCDNGTLVGMVTDRDIVLRGVARVCEIQSTPLSAVMSAEANWCYEDQSVDEVAARMQELQVRRMPVLDREQHLVGIVSLGDLATKSDDADVASDTLRAVSAP